MENQGTKIVQVTFKDNTELRIEAFVNEQFFLFDNFSSLTLYLPLKESVKQQTLDAINSGYIHICSWDANERYQDVTIDFLKDVRNIAII